MIEFVTAKTGERVIRWEGRLLASQVDPALEAREWFQRRSAFVTKVKTVFVLGAGSGFHIQEVARRTSAAIVVIEPEVELVQAVREGLGSAADRVKFISPANARELRADEAVRAAVAGSFVVLEHPASVSHDRPYYRECRAQLLGREWGALNWQWKLKGFADLDSQPRISAGGEPLTIYDLEQTELVQDSGERERMLLKALRELVK